MVAEQAWFTATAQCEPDTHLEPKARQMTKPSDEAQVIANFAAQRQALVEGDYDALADLLTDGFTRTHIDNRTLTKQQWLKHLRSGELTYHSFELVSVTAQVTDSSATMTARTISDATLYGERHQWKLEIRQTFIKTGGRWLASRSFVTQW